MLVCIGMYCNTYQYISFVLGMYFGMYQVCICTYYGPAVMQYIQNTNTIHTNTDWYAFNTYQDDSDAPLSLGVLALASALGQVLSCPGDSDASEKAVEAR